MERFTNTRPTPMAIDPNGKYCLWSAVEPKLARIVALEIENKLLRSKLREVNYDIEEMIAAMRASEASDECYSDESLKPKPQGRI